MSDDLRRVRVEVSAHHVHLSQTDQDRLFGVGFEMSQLKDLSQPGQWAASETIRIVGPKGEIKLRHLGPCRECTQVELSRTDCFALGLPVALRLSGDLSGTPGCKLVGPAGETELSEGVIVPLRHLHISDVQAAERGLKHGDRIQVRIEGERALTFDEVHVRVNPNFDLSIHLDTDEANAAFVDAKGKFGILES